MGRVCRVVSANGDLYKSRECIWVLPLLAISPRAPPVRGTYAARMYFVSIAVEVWVSVAADIIWLVRMGDHKYGMNVDKIMNVDCI